PPPGYYRDFDRYEDDQGGSHWNRGFPEEDRRRQAGPRRAHSQWADEGDPGYRGYQPAWRGRSDFEEDDYEGSGDGRLGRSRDAREDPRSGFRSSGARDAHPVRRQSGSTTRGRSGGSRRRT